MIEPMLESSFRKTTQHLMPAKHQPKPSGHYELYPTFSVPSDRIKSGYQALAQTLANYSVIIIDGFAGVMWEDFRNQLDLELQKLNLQAGWQNINDALKSNSEIENLIEPFMGEGDPIFGKRFTGTLKDFFNRELLSALQPNSKKQCNILYGTGAALANWDGYLIYLDLPKNELQFRARAGMPTNLGISQKLDNKTAYKRSYFIDWPALNKHKAHLLPHIDLIVDTQRPAEPTFMFGESLREGLEQMSTNYFRVRPWFEPGVWGGQWIKKHIPELAQDVPNYAWSFELITPENGLLFESDSLMLEVSFDLLMYQTYQNILGEAAEIFKYEFPIRFDWLDTIGGGNLSVQCHPSPDYIRKHFGETFTQDETYYMLDCKPSASVYLGFQEGISKQEFRHALEQSFQTSKPIDIERFIQKHPAKKHDLFLIPHGTIHCSGKGTLVLEISATPYIFTFKLYDWLRLDLDGKPRPINIERAFENLNFERRGENLQELISKPYVLESGHDWQILHLPTHRDHFYDVHRLEFSHSIDQQTNNQCHILCLVEGTSIILETQNGMRQRFNYSETFVIPAAAGSYKLINEGPSEAKVIKAFVKSGWKL
jgi:mannose-6-phosphate isomerase class I